MKRLVLFLFLSTVGLFANELKLDYSVSGYKIDEQKITIEQLESYIDTDHNLHNMYLQTRRMDKVSNIALITTASLIVVGTTTKKLTYSENGNVLQIIGFSSAFISLPLGIISSVKHNILVREYNSLLEKQSLAVGFNRETFTLQYSIAF